MNVFFSENQTDMLRGDLIVRLTQRSDLAPIPRTLELTVRTSQDVLERLNEGDSIWTGRENLEYKIVNTNKNLSSGYVQGNSQMGVVTVHAFLASCVQVGYRRAKAVIKENATFGEIFRACGATAQVGNDFAVARFTCFQGQIPSFELARALQEESGCLVLRDGRLMIMRLSDLFTQEAAGSMIADTAISMGSEFMERHEIPSFYSLADNGAMVQGNYDITRAVQYAHWQDERTLYNMTRVLVTRRKIPSSIATDLIAGDLITIGTEKFAVITTVNDFRQDGGVTQSDSMLYVGQLST